MKTTYNLYLSGPHIAAECFFELDFDHEDGAAEIDPGLISVGFDQIQFWSLDAKPKLVKMVPKRDLDRSAQNALADLFLKLMDGSPSLKADVIKVCEEELAESLAS